MSLSFGVFTSCPTTICLSPRVGRRVSRWLHSSKLRCSPCFNLSQLCLWVSPSTATCTPTSSQTPPHYCPLRLSIYSLDWEQHTHTHNQRSQFHNPNPNSQHTTNSPCAHTLLEAGLCASAETEHFHSVSQHVLARLYLFFSTLALSRSRVARCVAVYFISFEPRAYKTSTRDTRATQSHNTIPLWSLPRTSSSVGTPAQHTIAPYAAFTTCSTRCAMLCLCMRARSIWSWCELWYGADVETANLSEYTYSSIPTENTGIYEHITRFAGSGWLLFDM